MAAAALSATKLTRLAFAAGLAVSLCTLQLGLAVDDWGQVLRVRGAYPELGGPLDLFRFMGVSRAERDHLIAVGPWPWWTNPEAKAGFFRPLSSALIHLDVKVLGDHVVLWHLHSIAWYLALLSLAAAFYRRVLPKGALGLGAACALLFFAVDDAHWMPAGWLANRNSLVSSVPALLGVLLHLRWREEGWRPGAPLSALAYAVALCGGESALGVLGFVAAYELTGVRDDPWKQRLRALVPLLLVALAWAIAYRTLGYGAAGSAIYLDPLQEPVAWLSAFPGRLFAMLGSLTLGVSADAWMFLSKGRAVLVLVGLAGSALFALWLRAARPAWSEAEWRRIRWLTASGLLALLPVASTFPTDRLLLVPSLASAGVAASVLAALWSQTSAVARSSRVMLILTQLLMPVPAWVVGPWFLQSSADYTENGVMSAPVSDAALAQHVFLVAAPDALVAMYAPFARTLKGKPVPRSWHCGSYAPYAHRLKRVAESAVELEVVGGRLLGTVMEQLFRTARSPLETGASVQTAAMTFTVLEAIEGQPTKVRVDFTAPLSEVTVLQWRDDHLMPLELPPVGSEVTLEHQVSRFEQLRELLGG